jgi:hypothetical protein
MRKLLNRLLIKFGLLLTKAPTFFADRSLVRQGQPDTLKETEFSYLSANLDSNSFHDSIVVFDKKMKRLRSASCASRLNLHL